MVGRGSSGANEDVASRMTRSMPPSHQTCPICRGDVSRAFVARVKAAAAEPVTTMIADDFRAWLRDQAASAR